MIVKQKNIVGNPNIEADICIIGSGAAGITIALEFLNSDTSVVMLTGGIEKESSENQDMYRGASSIKNSHEPLEENRRRAFGGSTLAWGGRCVPYDEIDLKERNWIPDSEWPFNLKELRHYEKKAAYLCDIGDYNFNAISTFSKNSQKEILLGLDNENIISSKLERWSLPVNFAKKYKTVLERAKNIKVLLNTHVVGMGTSDENIKNISEVLAYINGKKIKVKASKYIMACGGIETPRLLLAFKNKNYPYGIGNARDVVGRYYMAHYCGVHMKIAPKDRSNILFDFEIDQGVYCRRRWWITEKFQQEKKIGNAILFLVANQDKNGHRDALFSMKYMVKLAISILKQRSVKNIKNNWYAIKEHTYIILTKVWKQLPEIISVAFKRSKKRRLPFVLPTVKSPYLGVYYQSEQIPCRKSRLILSEEEKDQFGIPRVIPKYTGSDLDKRTVIETHKLFVNQYKNAGLGEVNFDEKELLRQLEFKTKHFNSAAHHIGTTRISEDPNKGVVDVNCKVHDIDNLFIAGSSVFPTGSHANPTLMIVLMSLRLAEHLKTNF